MPRRRAAVFWAASTVAVVSSVSALGFGGSVHAAGLFVGTHGARPTALGGAFVAGADDLNALYYNPAGVVLAQSAPDGYAVLFDAGLVLQHVAYTRNDAGFIRPTVHADGGAFSGAPPVLPQVAFAKKWSGRLGSIALGLGLWTPYSSLARYPEGDYATEETRRQVPDTAPQRYQLVGLHDGSVSQATLAAVIHPVASFSVLQDRLQFGLGPQLLLMQFRAKLMLNGCPSVNCAPENPDYDALVLAQAFSLSPSMNLGVLWQPFASMRLGFSFQLPFFVRSLQGQVTTRLPAAELFNGAQVQGQDADFAMDLAPVLRLGAAFWLWQKRLRLEAAYTAEFWSIQDRLTVVPRNVRLVQVKGFDTYNLGPMAIDRQMQNTHAVHLGIEAVFWKHLGARLGGMFESGAMPTATMSVFSPDGPKGLMALGAFFPGVRFAAAVWRFDLGYARIIQADRTVLPEDSRLTAQNPLRPVLGLAPGQGGVGGGEYQVSYDLITVGFAVER